MEPIEYSRMANAEDGHWWFVHQRHLVHALIGSLYGPAPRDLDILDCGCGTGAMSLELNQYGSVVSVDVSHLATQHAQAKGVAQVVVGDGQRMPLRDGSFDLAVTLHTLEHVDDAAFLAELFRVLRPGGRLVATVPAFENLWSDHDVALHHRRRYTDDELRTRVQRAGFRVRHVSYTVMSLFPAIYAVRWLQRRLSSGKGAPQATVGRPPGALNRALIGLLDLENALLLKRALPFGTGLELTAERP